MVQSTYHSMNNFLGLFFIVLISISITGCCRCAQQSVSSDMKDTKNIASIINENLGAKASCQYNESGTLQLCVKDDDPKMDPLRKAYMVIDNDGDIILPVDRVHGEIEWHSDDEISVNTISRVQDKRSSPQMKTKIISLKKQ